MAASRRACFAVLVAGSLLTLVYAVSRSPVVDTVAAITIGVGACAAQVLGLRLNRPADRVPWRLFPTASAMFLAGVMLRPWSAEQDGFPLLAADVATTSGYVLLATGLALLLRPRGGLERHALTDGVIVCLATGLLAMEFLALPAARIGDRPELVSLLAGLYPMWDVVVALLVLNLGFSTAVRLPTFRFLALAMTVMFVGDLGYAVIGAQGQLTGPPVLDLPYLVGYTLFAAAALHPSMARMSTITAMPVQAWSARRLALILPTPLAPLIVILWSRLDATDRVVLAVATASLMAAFVVRALSAVRRYDAVQRGLLHEATHDALTGLPNRTLILELLDGLVEEMRADGASARRGVWLLFMDLDGFKAVNDHWGHDIGDALLIEVSRRLRWITDRSVAEPVADGHHPPGSRPPRTRRLVAGRISGDEFVVAGPGGLSLATALAGDIQRELSRPVNVPGAELFVRSSIGIVAVTEPATAEELLRDADLAMYQAKADKRDRWRVFDHEIRQAAEQRVEIELALRRAIGRGELWVAYQPIVDCDTGRLAGAEALLRWDHPVRGPVPPDRFIPVAEETGLIDDIGAFALEESLRQLAAWRDHGLLPDDFQISVNVSTRQLRDHRVRHQVETALIRYGLTADRLVLEITESVMLGDSDVVADVLGALRRLGVGLSLDDFGTGFSSLGYLSRFPVTALKIDRSFVRGLGVDPADEAIVRSVAGIAEALRLRVVAEGVETIAQQDALRALDVHHAQGWLWAPAERPEVFADRHLRGAPAVADQVVAGNS